MANLKIAPRKTGYARGQELYEKILQSAFEILVDEGLDALSFGSIAKSLNTKPANINYYFPSKEALIADLLGAIMTSYQHQIESICAQCNVNTEERFKSIVEMIVFDLASKETTRVFPELWARANRDSFFQKRLDEIYEFGRRTLTDLIAEMRPDLSSKHCELIGYHAQAALEGLTIFAGHNKPLQPKIRMVANIAKSMLLEGVLNISAEDIVARSKK
ncbi:MAG: TetR/AcrR family transcriptional regulator [Steroidobacteraceae bacterium]